VHTHRFRRFVFSGLFVLAMAAPVMGQSIALLDSSSTREFFKRHYAGCSAPSYYLPDGEEYQRYVRGWEFVLQEMGADFGLIGDAQLTAEGLAGYRLLILSNIASVSEEQTRAIKHWVAGGGRLIATFGTSYKSTDYSPREADLLKPQKGSTFGLHELWHDPTSKTFGTEWIGGVVDVRISRYEGPTAPLAGTLANNLLGYGALGNVLVSRPEQAKHVLGWLELKTPSGPVRPLPGIISTRFAKGQVVYFAFAPEYLVSKEFALPTDIACPDGQNWAGRSTDLRRLMAGAVRFLQ